MSRTLCFTMRRGVCAFLFALATLVWASTVAAQDDSPVATRPPNIVFILMDDLGWADLGYMGSEFHETPHIDQLAARGTVYTQAYATCPVCSPTRASILTGQSPAKLRLTNFLIGERVVPEATILPAPFEHSLRLDVPTLPQLLKPAGYKSCHLGKWHLGWGKAGAHSRGWDEIIGEVAGTAEMEFPASGRLAGLRGKPGDYLTDRLTDEAIRFIEQHRAEPFYLAMDHFAVHIPLHGKKDVVKKFRAKADPRQPQHNAEYAAMLAAADESVGRIMQKLSELKLLNNTIVVFTSDNGGQSVEEGPNTPATSNLPLRAGKGYLYEGGLRVPLIIKWPANIEAPRRCESPVSSLDFVPTFLEMAGIKDLPPNLEGINLAADNGCPSGDRALYWHYPHFSNQGGRPGGVVREGKYKLIEFYENGRTELYDLSQDIGERRDLAAKDPQRVEELREKLAAWRVHVGANMPRLNPAVKPRSGEHPITTAR